MPKASRLKLAPLPASDETAGERLVRIRRERGFTQKEMAEKTGFIQALVSDYECDKLGLNANIILRFARALEVCSAATGEVIEPGGAIGDAREHIFQSGPVINLEFRRHNGDRSNDISAANQFKIGYGFDEISE